MMLVSIPMLVLYVGGYVAIRVRDNRLSRHVTAAKSS